MAKRTQAFVLANSRQGSFIVSRLDRSTSPSGNSFGIGYQILENGAYDAEEVNLLLQLAQLLKRVRYVKGGPPLIFVDCGANIGVHTVSLA
jgi:hypothetical protein